MPSTITKAVTTSILLPDNQNLGITVTGGVLDVGDDGAIIYEIQMPTYSEEELGTETISPRTLTITDGPWATDSASGQYEMFYSTRFRGSSGMDRAVQSIHCEMSSTVAKECTLRVDAGFDDISYTTTYDNRIELEAINAYKFTHYPFVVTSGQALLGYRSSVLSTYTPTVTDISSEEESETASTEASDTTETSASSEASDSTGASTSIGASTGTGASTSDPASTKSTPAETSTSQATEESSTPEPTSGASSGLLRVYTSMAAAAVAMMAVSL